MAQVTEKTVTVKVKDHPREMYYRGRQTTDHLQQMIKFMSTRSKVPDLDLVETFLKTVNIGDTVGVEHNQYKVEELNTRTFSGTNLHNKTFTTLSPEEITIGLGTTFCEILYRDGKPYGIETEKQVKVKIVDHTKQSEEGK